MDTCAGTFLDTLLDTPDMTAARRIHLDPSAFVADPRLLEALARRSAKIVCSGDQVLFTQGELLRGLYILLSGSATLSMTAASGGRIEISRLSAGSLLGLPGMIGDQPSSLSAEACRGSELGFVTREDLRELMLADPALSLMVLGVLAGEVRIARQALSRL